MLQDKNITMYKQHWDRAQELADANSRGNRSRMLFILAHSVYIAPEEFGLLAPSDRKGWNDAIAHGTKNPKGESVCRSNVCMDQEEWRVIQWLANSNTRGNRSILLRHLIDMAYEQPTRFSIQGPDVPATEDPATEDARSTIEPLDVRIFQPID